MSMQTSRIALPVLLMLGACGGNETGAQSESEAGQAAEEGKVECALAGSAVFERNCTTEQIAGSDGTILVIRHPDGGFRRFDILTDGRGLAPADGFDETKITLSGNGMIEVSSGDDKYRLPAQIKGQGAPEAETAAKDGG